MKKKNGDRISDDLDEIIKVYKLMVKQKLTEINWDQGKKKLLIRRRSNKPKPVEAGMVVPPQGAASPQQSPAVEPEKKEAKEDNNIESPMNGILYRSPSPGAETFVKEGENVSAGQTLCIIEAMKSMNEIKAERGCKILKFLVADSGAVTAGQPIISILPK